MKLESHSPFGSDKCLVIYAYVSGNAKCFFYKLLSLRHIASKADQGWIHWLISNWVRWTIPHIGWLQTWWAGHVHLIRWSGYVSGTLVQHASWLVYMLAIGWLNFVHRVLGRAGSAGWYWLIGWLVGSLVNMFVGWLVGWVGQVGWLVMLVAGGLVGWLVGWCTVKTGVLK